jgi:hypothetical protein
MLALFFRHWYFSGEVPVAATEKVAVWPTVTVALAGCAVMLGAVPPEFELEVVVAQPPTSKRNAATLSNMDARELRMKPPIKTPVLVRSGTTKKTETKSAGGEIQYNKKGWRGNLYQRATFQEANVRYSRPVPVHLCCRKSFGVYIRFIT